MWSRCKLRKVLDPVHHSTRFPIFREKLIVIQANSQEGEERDTQFGAK